MSEAENNTEHPVTPPAARVSGRLTQWALAIALIALLATAWQWLDQRHRANRLENTLTQRLGAFDERNRESELLAKRADESVTEATAKIALLNQKLDESRDQQEALQTLYLELANNRDEWTISEVEQLLIIASQQLQLAGNVKPALLALQTADSRLQDLDKPQIIQLRKIIGKDIQRLQALPSVDTVGLSLKLEGLLEAADKLPLASEHHPNLDNGATTPDYSSNPWRRLMQEVWQDMKRMIRIERMDRPEAPLLTPEQAYFLRENLKLRLLSARIAMLQHDEFSYRNDLRLAEAWLKTYFDMDDTATKTAFATLEQLLASAITLQLPDVNASLNAVSKYKLTLERSKQ
jgi:uroporphyrin-III C-methyltransferase